MSDSTTLKPCPFCGAMPEQSGTQTQCSECYATMFGGDREDMTARWNRRTGEGERLAQVFRAASEGAKLVWDGTRTYSSKESEMCEMTSRILAAIATVYESLPPPPEKPE